MLKKKKATLGDLENAMDPELLAKMKQERDKADGSQYRPRPIEFPTRLDILKRIQQEEGGRHVQSDISGNAGSGAVRSSRLTGSVGINMGLDLEMKQ